MQIAEAVGRAALAARRLLFPPHCPGCRRLVARPGTLCPACWKGVRFLDEPVCAVLGTPFASDQGPGAVSPEAFAEPPAFDRARAAVTYSGVARRMAQDLKYRDRTDLAPWMAEWMLRAGAELVRDAELVVPVPLHRRRFLARRFNQSAELARAVALRAGLPCEMSALERVRATRRQVGLSARERETNVRAAFRVPEVMKPRVSGRRVLLVDDVLTTGATVSAAARALRRAGAAEISVLTFARVVAEDFHASEPGSI